MLLYDVQSSFNLTKFDHELEAPNVPFHRTHVQGHHTPKKRS